MKKIEYRPIGIIHSPYKTPEGTPIQPTHAQGPEAKVEVLPEYAEGLTDLAGFSHIYLIYHFHLSKKFSLMVKPFLDTEFHGLFSTRAPSRPNSIGLSIVRLTGIKENILRVKNIDVLDGTPLLDIKPYVPGFDICKVNKIGWMEKKIKNLAEAQDDGRFAE
ncbi:MAG: tRNA (N6-threonylcarbamoyladenosine(37)-N6)-methyltransferase TrmO [Desulfobacterales bacterium]|mgnify:FL=1|jgi:tRNA-Thr(GGU) m(6)t(6)A37 methyltransferase TsaA